MDYKCNYKWKIHRPLMFTNVNSHPFGLILECFWAIPDN